MTKHLVSIAALVCTAGQAADYDLISAKQPYALIGDAVVTSPRTRQVYFFTATWCRPCSQWKSSEQKRMERSGWRFGSADDLHSHVRVIDSDKHRDLVSRMKVEAIPAFVIVDHVSGGATEVGRLTGGGVTAEQIDQLFSRSNDQ